MDNVTQQADEIEALGAIYGDDFQVENEEYRSYSVKIMNDVKLFLKLPDDYPSSSPPSYELFAPHWNSEKKQYIYRLLDEVYLSCVGENVIYQWVEKIREESLNLNRPEPKKVEDNHEDSSANLTENLEESIKIENEKCPEIFHGEVIVDRKSSFQGHAAQVHSVDDVKLVMKTLLKNRKIENATHNIYAYRIFDENKKTYIHDCVDDGETQAGGRLLHFLQIVDINNLIVVVSRWYGGIHLGPDRFRHINNAARQVLESANFLSKNKRQ